MAATKKAKKRSRARRKGAGDFETVLQNVMDFARRQGGILSERQLLSLLPTRFQSEDVLSDMATRLIEAGVEILTDEEFEERVSHRKHRRATNGEDDIEIQLYAEEEDLFTGGDPAKTYLKQISDLGLLTKEEEQFYARELNEARRNLTRMIMETPFGWRHLLQLMDRVPVDRSPRDGEKLLEEVVEVDSQFWTSRKVNERERKRVREAFETLRQTLQALLKLAEQEPTPEAEARRKELLNQVLSTLNLVGEENRDIGIILQFHPVMDILEAFLERARKALEFQKTGHADQAEALSRELGVPLEQLPEMIQAMEQELERYNHARDTLVKGNVRLVIGIAKRFSNRGLEFMDLVQEGNAGLIKAVEKFDYRKGYKFSTYATWWIRQSITRAIADQSRTIRVPIHMIELITKISRVTRDLLQELGREPTPEEVARRLKVSTEKVRQAMKAAKDPISLDRPIGHDKENHIAEFVVDDASRRPDEAAFLSVLQERLQEVLNALPLRERQILEMRFGLTTERPMTLEEVGDRFGVTRERIRQIENKALRMLRSPEIAKKLEIFLKYIDQI